MLLTIRILSNNRMVSLQRLGFTLLIDSFDPELVFFSLLETLDVHFGVIGLSNWYPAASGFVELLDHIASNGLAWKGKGGSLNVKNIYLHIVYNKRKLRVGSRAESSLTTIVFRLLPGQFTSSLGDISHLKWTSRFARSRKHGDLNIGFVLAVFVGRQNTVRASHGTN